MSKNEEELHIYKCLALIEEKLGWGKSEGWTNYDFEKLSEAIYSRTTVQLSVTTLKRIWGKLKYESAPTLTTLNTLAQFSGFEDWRAFRIANPIQQDQPRQVTAAVVMPVQKVKSRWTYGFAVIVTLLIAGYFFVFSMVRTARPDPDKFQFEANKMVTEGVPNSVVFHYDARAAATDSVFIVQTWDIRRKVRVPREKQDHSAIYYYPGFFVTKLIVDGAVVKTHDLWITSDGWLCLAENEPTPLYFSKKDYLKGDRIEVDKKMLEAYNLPLHPKAPRIRFFNQHDLGDLMNDNFIFETSLRNELNDGANACQYVEVLIQCKNDIIVIPLVAKTCVGDLRLYFCGTEVISKDADLSGFGGDLTQWTKLRVETVDKNVTIFVNDAKAYTLKFPHDPTGIVGVQYRFNGVGAVKDTRFMRGEKVYAFGAE